LINGSWEWVGVKTTSFFSNDLVDISHTYIGDLRVAVSNPQNHEIVLHAQEGRSADDIQRTYTVDEKPALRDFIGQPAAGDWVLSVSDNAWRDVGKLNRWSLMLR
jgi:subtilisin-like proprotein convertase family protein